MTSRQMYNILMDTGKYHLSGGMYDVRRVMNAIIRMLNKG